ncbi:MAG: carboxylesterase [Gammaproteobacteria bacterium]|nr:carboxylesterase [Gammaproteobacteria bacterium]
MTKSQEDLLYIEINPDMTANFSVIWLHGLGADGNDFVPFVEALQLPQALPTRFIFPHAPIMPITINNGYAMRAWYDIYSVDINARLDEQKMTSSVALVQGLIEQEINKGIPAKHIILGGFSQGAVIAYLAGLSSAHSLGGIVGLSGYLPRSAVQANVANQDTPIFIGHGTEDQIVSYALGKAACMYLKERGYPVSWHSYPMAHTASPQEIHDIRNWLLKAWQ